MGYQIARDGEHRIGRVVILAVMLIQVVALNGMQIFDAADHLVAVGVCLKGGCFHGFIQAKERFVLISLAL